MDETAFKELALTFCAWKNLPMTSMSSYLTTLEVFLFNFQTVGTASAAAQDFGDRVRDLLHWTLDAIHSCGKIRSTLPTFISQNKINSLFKETGFKGDHRNPKPSQKVIFSRPPPKNIIPLLCCLRARAHSQIFKRKPQRRRARYTIHISKRSVQRDED